MEIFEHKNAFFGGMKVASIVKKKEYKTCINRLDKNFLKRLLPSYAV